MEFFLDTVDLDEIRDGVDHMPISGITCNPSIVKKTAPADFYAHMREVRNIIGKDRTLHIQCVAEKAEDIVREAHRVYAEVDDQVYIKIPTSYEGVRAMKLLKAEGRNVTATAIYTDMQAYMAMAAGADYMAPYYNRIGNLGGDPDALIRNVSARIDHDGYDCRIVAASFHFRKFNDHTHSFFWLLAYLPLLISLRAGASCSAPARHKRSSHCLP